MKLHKKVEKKITNKWSWYDEFVHSLLLYGFGFGWLLPIWFREYRWRLFFTWIGIAVLAFGSCQVKKDKKEKSK